MRVLPEALRHSGFFGEGFFEKFKSLMLIAKSGSDHGDHVRRRESLCRWVVGGLAKSVAQAFYRGFRL